MGEGAGTGAGIGMGADTGGETVVVGPLGTIGARSLQCPVASVPQYPHFEQHMEGIPQMPLPGVPSPQVPIIPGSTGGRATGADTGDSIGSEVGISTGEGNGGVGACSAETVTSAQLMNLSGAKTDEFGFGIGAIGVSDSGGQVPSKLFQLDPVGPSGLEVEK